MTTSAIIMKVREGEMLHWPLFCHLTFRINSRYFSLVYHLSQQIKKKKKWRKIKKSKLMIALMNSKSQRFLMRITNGIAVNVKNTFRQRKFLRYTEHLLFSL